MSAGLQEVLKWPCSNRSSNCNYVMRNLTLKLQRSSEGGMNGGVLEWWELMEECSFDKRSNDLPLGDQCQHLNLYTFNEKAFPPTLSFISGSGYDNNFTSFSFRKHLLESLVAN